MAKGKVRLVIDDIHILNIHFIQIERQLLAALFLLWFGGFLVALERINHKLVIGCRIRTFLEDLGMQTLDSNLLQLNFTFEQCPHIYLCTQEVKVQHGTMLQIFNSQFIETYVVTEETNANAVYFNLRLQLFLQRLGGITQKLILKR